MSVHVDNVSRISLYITLFFQLMRLNVNIIKICIN